MDIDFDALIDSLKASLIAWGPRVIAALAILIIGFMTVKIITSLLGRAMNRARLDTTLVRFISNFAFMLLMTLVVIFTIGKLGVDTTSFAAVIAAAGLAIGLALQGSLGNFASGVMIIGLRPFRVGDLVELNGVMGKVEAVGVFFTELTRPDNTRIVVPNGQVIDDNIINYTINGTRRIDLVAGIGYGDDIKEAKEVFERILAAHPQVLDEPAPQVAVAELADSSVNFVVRPWVQAADYWAVRCEITEQIKLELDAAGINIPFPQRDVHLHQVA